MRFYYCLLPLDYDGGEDDRRNSDNNAPKRAGPDEFGRAVSKIAVAQICESVGFEGFQDSALQALSNIAVRYLCDVGKTANFCANLADICTDNSFMMTVLPFVPVYIEWMHLILRCGGHELYSSSKYN
ncbi:unnamed protein product, partial [Vitis vinifera]